MTDDKKKALEQTILQIEKEFGKGSIMKLGSYAATRNIEVIPTGCLTLDLALGIGGLPKGRIIEIYGPEASGKTTVTLHVIAQVQKMGGTAAFIDAEQALDPVYAKNLGINLDELYISQPDSGEQALDILEYLVRSNAVDLIVVDSVAALTPKSELEGDMGESHMGVQARLMSQALRKLVAIGNKSNTCIIFINQLRDKIGVMFGSPETTTGGKALKFYSSVRLDVRRVDQVKDGSDIVGSKTRVKVVKNKVAPPFKTAEFEIIFGKGISNSACILDAAVERGLIEKSGSWFSYNGEKIAQGREKAKAWLEAHPEIMESIQATVKAELNPPAEEE
ncbi:MAG: recombinase RecA [Clostridia bacterium]|nr:recombinase RecA [Clostridia bacterium]MBR1955197.1 recombinase RecA [Clostridia bacterium]MBR2986185.1 recombinase RecA [Clostridia bacterium]